MVSLPTNRLDRAHKLLTGVNLIWFFLFVSYNIFLSVEKWDLSLCMRSVTPHAAAAPSRVVVDE
jgi:hypothetical protein